MVILLGLAAAVLYGGGDFLGGLAARRAHVLGVLHAGAKSLGQPRRSPPRPCRQGCPASPASPGGSAPATIGGRGPILHNGAAGPTSRSSDGRHPRSGRAGWRSPTARPAAGVYAGALLARSPAGQLGPRNQPRTPPDPPGPANAHGIAGRRPVLAVPPQPQPREAGNYRRWRRADRGAGGRPGDRVVWRRVSAARRAGGWLRWQRPAKA